jgi:lysophospholipase L1-like esterase
LKFAKPVDRRNEMPDTTHPSPRPPAKTAAAILWFCVLGAGAYAAVSWWQPRTAEADGAGRKGSAGPGAIPGASDDALASEFEDEIKAFDARSVAGLGTKTPHQSIEDQGGKSMDAFYGALERLASGRDRKSVHIVHYGDSILATDEISGHVRRILQTRFGDGGHGFVLLGKPWRWYHHLDVEHGASGDWRARPLTSDPLTDGMYGLGGVAFESRARAASAWAGTATEGALGRRVASFDVSYLEQPGGGTFDVLVDGAVVATVDSRGAVRRTVHRRIDVKPGPARITVRLKGDGGVVRLFGVALDSGQPGVVHDSLAINGARATVLARFDEAHWKAELAARDPDLVVLMFGANEGHNEWLSLPEVSRDMGRVIGIIKAGVPRSSCLVVGALDQAKKDENGDLVSRSMPARLSKVQREVALASGCAFFDTFTAMGGKNSMAHWYNTGLGGGDLIHPTEQGARRIGTWLAEALLFGFEEWKKGR